MRSQGLWSFAIFAYFAVGEYITGDVDQPAALNSRAAIEALIGPGTIAGDTLENGIYAVTATVQYDLWKNVLSRLEFRWDHAEHGNTFGALQGDGTAAANNALMLAANLIYKF